MIVRNKMEEVWNENDIDSIYEYMGEDGAVGVLSVLNIYEKTPDEIRAMDYPPTQDSKIFRLGLKKHREVPYGISLQYPGDWKKAGKLSPDEIKERDRILKDREPKEKRTLDDIL